ncbi:MAG: DUF2802 domain-containing protein [Gammaproteobacteria bacterium]
MNIFEFLLTTITFPVAMQVVSLLLLGVLLSFLIKTRKQRIKDFHDISELRRDLRALTTAAMGVGERVLKVERQQKNENSVTNINTVTKLSHNNESSYEHAIHLVQKGANVNDLVNTCGLSQGEADLVDLLHRVNELQEKKVYKN